LFSPTEIRVAAGSELEIRFENQDPYNHAIYIVVGAVRPSVTTGEALAASVFRGAYVGGPATYAYRVPALTPGTYTFLCPPHEPMSGTIVVEE
jgi:plastocyanin